MSESPCIGVCSVVGNICIGCFRSKEQIKNWLYYSEDERKSITKQCIKKMKLKTEKRK